MYRRGPSKATPTNVQCQKCLKRDMYSTDSQDPRRSLTFEARHYSYECKTTTQERPYVPRPSRTQQLLNPKLVPKLTSETPNALEKKKGVADEELAKREAERARKRELERDDDDDDESGEDRPPRRKRSYSRDSASTTSSRAPRSAGVVSRNRGSSRSPARAASRAFESPPPSAPASRALRENSYGSDEDDARGSHHAYQSRSVTPEARRSEKPRSPARRASPPRARYDARSGSSDDAPAHRRRRRYSSSPSRSPPPDDSRRHRFRSRSPGPPRARGRSPPRRRGDSRAGRLPGEERGEHGESRDDDRGGGAPRRREQRRERSLSPFSKRLALTQAMNMGR